MFLGTLGVSATALVVLIVVAPARFGLARMGTDAGGQEPLESAGAAGSFEGSTVEMLEGGVSSGMGYLDARWPSGPSNPTGSAEGPGEAPWSAADRPFTARPVNPGASSLGPRSVVEREWVPPTLPERIFADAQPSVVLVATLSDREEKFKRVRFVAGTGSGLVWDQDGHIVTSRHVIENVVGANVTFSDGSRWAARLINVDQDSDVAVMKIERRPGALTPIRVGTSADLVVGMTSFSVSSPYGLQDSLSSGLVSGLNRNILTSNGLEIGGMIQTDAPLHPGSSGGALIDDQGRVIGMNTAVHLESGLPSGVGFAIPMDRLQEIVPRLIRTGMHRYGGYGFSTLSVESMLSQDDEYAEHLKRRGGSLLSRSGGSELPTQGLVVTNVEPESGAAGAGFRSWVQLQGGNGSGRTVVRDVVVGVAGVALSDGVELKQAIAKLAPDEPLKLDIWRNGMELSVIVQRTATPRDTVRSEGR